MTNDDRSHNEIDEITGTETTGHEWDGIKELDTPMPRWWVLTFYATIVFAIGYVIYYPAIPLIETSTAGISGITTRGQFEDELVELRKASAAKLERIKATPFAQIKTDENLYRYAVAGGRSLYKVYCSQCHGSGAQGAAGYPNLNDDDWLWGGNLKSIYTTIAHGVRSDDDEDTRSSLMPSFGKDEILEKVDIRAVTEFVLKLSGNEHRAAQAKKGATIFADNCASCHGDAGKGNREFGAPNLADALSLYGTTRAKISAQVTAARHGVMPPWQARLGDARVKQLTLYVHSLGGGENTPPPAQTPEQSKQEPAKPKE
jgi:cytochrome c oxidase cbb3-type subunit 3